MKKSLFLFACISLLVSEVFSQNATEDSLGLPGDNLNLYAVLDLFSKSETFEIFEEKLNEENTKVNNLDLNNDGKTDYIRVIDNKDGDNHAIVLQDVVSETESQDVAVIELEKNSSGMYTIQIIGNEELYGKDYIIEPIPEASQGTVNPAANQQVTKTVYVQPAQWPIVVYVYRPAYVVYASPWRWGYYPARWRPWRPLYYRGYYGYYHHRYPVYHQYYHRTVVYRSPIVHNYYGGRRTSSTVVVQNKNQGVYRSHYTRSGSAPRTRSNPAYRQNNAPQRMNATPQGNTQQPAMRSRGGNAGNRNAGVQHNGGGSRRSGGGNGGRHSGGGGRR